MTRPRQVHTNQLFGRIYSFLRRCIFNVLSIGPLPNHIAFIMDGNRRYARKKKIEERDGYRMGCLTLMSILKYCYELKIKYITIYAFSIDNFKRQPEYVRSLMDLMLEKTEIVLKEQNIANEFGVRVQYVGNLSLLSETLRAAAEKAMEATAKNTNIVLLVCLAYTTGDEIVHALEESCHDKRIESRSLIMDEVEDEDRKKHEKYDEESCHDKRIESRSLIMDEAEDRKKHENLSLIKFVHALEESCHDKRIESRSLIMDEDRKEHEKLPLIKLADIEKHMYMSVAPDPDILVRSGGETRLSNFMLWQTRNCLLYFPTALWPELGLWHLVCAVLKFQRHYFYLEKIRKKS